MSAVSFGFKLAMLIYVNAVSDTKPLFGR